jgi:hypothetical protein
MASTNHGAVNLPALPTWMNSGTSARLWLSYWPLMEPAVHTLKLTTLKIHEYGLQFESDHALSFGTPLHIRLLLPPMTAIAVQGLVIHEEPATQEGKHLVSVRFTSIREADRRRLGDYSSARRVGRSRVKTGTEPRKASIQTF